MEAGRIRRRTSQAMFEAEIGPWPWASPSLFISIICANSRLGKRKTAATDREREWEWPTEVAVVVARRWICSGRNRCSWFSSSFPWNPLTSPSHTSVTLAFFSSKMWVVYQLFFISLTACWIPLQIELLIAGLVPVS